MNATSRLEPPVPTVARARALVERLRRRVWRWRCRGTGVTCPCCGSELRRLAPGGRPVRPRAECPICGSRERHRALSLFLDEERFLGQRGRVLLHLAPEPFLTSRLREIAGGYITGDLERSDVDVRFDLGRVPLRSEAIDLILCSHVLEHVADDRGAMADLRRVLHEGGVAVVAVPLSGDWTTIEDLTASAEERLRRFGQSDHVRSYGNDIEDRLREAGFGVERRDLAQRWSPEIRTRFGLADTEVVFLCTHRT